MAKDNGLLKGIRAIIDASADCVEGIDGSAEHWRLTPDKYIDHVAARQEEWHRDFPTAGAQPKYERPPERSAVLSVIANAMAQRAIDSMHDAFYSFGSPIEEQFFFGVLFAAWGRGAQFEYVTGNKKYSVRHDVSASTTMPERVSVWIQPELAGMHPDFLVHFEDWVGPDDQLARSQLAVECDGHDFHERTKEQARRDKGRDRKLVAAGVQVVRFTGSEIFADPLRCGGWVLDTLKHTLFRPVWSKRLLDPDEIARLAAEPGRRMWVERETGRTMAEWEVVLGVKLPGGVP